MEEARQDSEKLGNSLASGIGKLRKMAEHSGGAIYSQVQMATRGRAPRSWQGAKLEK